MRTLIAIALIALVTFTAPAWTQIPLESPAVMAFVISDRFWPAVFGMVLATIFIGTATLTALVFHPGALSGREPEGGK